MRELQGKNNLGGRGVPGQYRAELHDRLAAPLYAFVFVAVTFAFLGSPRTTRQSRNFSTGCSILLVFASVVCAGFGSRLYRSGRLGIGSLGIRCLGIRSHGSSGLEGVKAGKKLLDIPKNPVLQAKLEALFGKTRRISTSICLRTRTTRPRAPRLAIPGRRRLSVSGPRRPLRCVCRGRDTVPRRPYRASSLQSLAALPSLDRVPWLMAPQR
jgi:hypothetical protein